jgi:hypothetical protein
MTTPLVNPACQTLGVHIIDWHGIGLCCVCDHSEVEQRPRRLSRPHGPVKPSRSPEPSPRETHGAHS